MGNQKNPGREAMLETLTGRTIDGRYLLTGLIGQGGMGAVFRAVHFNDPSRVVVLKMVRKESNFATVQDHQRFNKEAALLSKLYHPHIVGFHSFGVLNPANNPEALSGFYLIMDWIQGRSLKEHIVSKHSDLSFFFQVSLQICAALDYTHSKNIVHRDLKPSNILIKPSVRDLRGVKSIILDFGIARLNEIMQSTGISTGDSGQKSRDDLIGTPVYMAPEQTPFAEGFIDHRTDLYALGCLFYEMLAGRPPFFRGSRIQILKQQARSRPTSLQVIRPELPPMLNEIIFRLLEKKPENRYQSAFSLYSDLQKTYAFLTRDKSLHVNRFAPGGWDHIKSVTSEIKHTGQKDNTKKVHDILDQIRNSSRGRVIGIQGSVGTGKSKFLGEIKKELQKRQLRFISGEFLEYASGLPFHTLAGAFYDYMLSLEQNTSVKEALQQNLRNTLGNELKTLGNLIPGLTKFFPELKSAPLSLQIPANRSVLSKVFSDFLRCLFQNQTEPVVFLFDNINKADELSLSMLSEFVSHTNSLPFILILTYQPWFHQFQPHLASFIKNLQMLKRRYLPVVLNPLSKEESRELLEEFLGGTRISETAASDYFFRHSQGNPSHLLALARKCLILECLTLTKSEDGTTEEFTMPGPPEGPVRTDSVEQALRTMESYPAGHWQILELCSTMGNEVMIRPGIFEPWFPQEKVQSVLRQCEKDGLLYKKEVSEDGQITSVFRFSHFYLREVIYQALPEEKKFSIHLTLFRFYEKKKDPDDSEGSLLKGCYHAFWLADCENEPDINLSRIFAFIKKTAENVLEKKDYFTSLLIFLKSLSILEKNNPSGEKVGELKAWLFSGITHCYASLKQWDRAKSFAELSCQYQTRPQEKSQAQAMLMQLCLIQGDRQTALKLADRFLNKSRYDLKTDRISSRLKTGLSVLRDFLLPGSEVRQLTGCISAFKKVHRKPGLPAPSRSPDRDVSTIFRVQDILFNFRFYQWLAFHYRADESIRNAPEHPGTFIRHNVYKAIFWSFLGRHRRAADILKNLLDLSEALEDRSGAALSSFALALAVHYEENRPGSLHLHLNESLKHLSQRESPSLFPRAWLLKAFLSVQEGKLQEAEHILEKSLYRVGSSRSAILQWGAMQLFVDFLSGRRDTMLRHGEDILQRIQSEENSGPGLYGHLITLFVAFAKGDVHKTRKSFHDVAYAFSGGLKKIILFNFEQDLVSLILCSFPMIFEQENKRQLMRKKEMEQLLLWLKKKVLGRSRQERDTFLLLKGKVLDDLQTASCRKHYKKALEIARDLGHDLISCLCCLWYGQNLEDIGSDKPVYLKEAWDISRKRNFTTLQKYIEGTVLNEKDGYHSLIKVPKVTVSNLPFQEFPSVLAFNHLAYLSKPYVRGITYKHSLEKSMHELLKYYRAACVRILFRSPDGSLSSLCFPEDLREKTSSAEVAQHLEPFLNLSESMFVPPVVCPWTQSGTGATGSGKDQTESSTNIETVSIDPTLTVDLSEDTKKYETAAETLSPAATAAGSAGPMHAYIPVNSSSGNQGVLMVEHIPSEFTAVKVMASRQELDMFGAQLGLVMERDFFARDTQTYSDQWKMNYAEHVPWLRTWSKGSPDSPHISCWSLGLALPENSYLLIFCELSGGEEKQRQLISSMIWHHIHILQVLSRNKNKTISLTELRDHMNSLLSLAPGSQTLGNIAISFSLLSKGSDYVNSGHFGESRPLILAGTNLVKPFNEVIMTFDHGRNLRYWEVRGTRDELLPLFVCGNSHSFDVKLNIRDVEKLREQVRGQSPEAGLHQFLERAFPASQMPPYYVAVIAQNRAFLRKEPGSGRFTTLNPGTAPG